MDSTTPTTAMTTSSMPHRRLRATQRCQRRRACTPPAPTPATLIDSKPAPFTNSTSATFSFHSNPAGASFECRLDRLSFQDCDSGTVTYAGPLSEATHSFRIRASNANGVGAPVTFAWTVDLTAPLANITSHPIDPSPGQSASFRYGSNEGGSKFECQTEPARSRVYALRHPTQGVLQPCRRRLRIRSARDRPRRQRPGGGDGLSLDRRQLSARHHAARDDDPVQAARSKRKPGRDLHLRLQRAWLEIPMQAGRRGTSIAAPARAPPTRACPAAPTASRFGR